MGSGYGLFTSLLCIFFLVLVSVFVKPQGFDKAMVMMQGMKGASLKFDTEKEVFDFLGFPCLEPHERNLWNFM